MKKKTRTSRGNAASDAGLGLSRTEALLAQLLMQSMGSGGQEKKALALRAAGLSNVEIAQLLGTTAAVVGQVLYQARRDRVAGRKTSRPKQRKR
jgi:DNA-directed RNA polymerase specialized sigma24 family protein